MKIICPNCHSEYNVDKKELPKSGRKTKCFVCNSIWTQYASGKAEQIREIKDFIDQIKIRQDSIKASLKTNIDEKKSSSKATTYPLNKDEEREFLAALAIDEIQGNREWTKTAPILNPNTSEKAKEPDEVTENFSHSTKIQKHDKITQKNINRTFLGFLIVSIICMLSLVLFTNRTIITQLDTKYQKPLLDFLQITDILVEQIKNYILTIKDSIYSYFFNKN